MFFHTLHITCILYLLPTTFIAEQTIPKAVPRSLRKANIKKVNDKNIFQWKICNKENIYHLCNVIRARKDFPKDID